MLSGIHPLLTGDLLAALDRLGHGEELVVADANFPAHRFGKPVVELPGVASPDAVRAIRTVLPLDRYEGASVLLMEPGAEGHERHEVQEVQTRLVEASVAPDSRVTALERFAFYDRAAGASLIVRTGELRPYGNLVLRKGVVNEYHPGGAA